MLFSLTTKWVNLFNNPNNSLIVTINCPNYPLRTYRKVFYAIKKVKVLKMTKWVIKMHRNASYVSNPIVPYNQLWMWFKNFLWLIGLSIIKITVKRCFGRILEYSFFIDHRYIYKSNLLFSIKYGTWDSKWHLALRKKKFLKLRPYLISSF